MRRFTYAPERRPERQRGGALVNVLFFLMVTSVLLAGVGSFAVSHQTRAQVDSDFARAMDIAEAGANYEFNKISKDETTADQPGAGPSYGNSYSFGGGTFRVYCTQTAPPAAPTNWTAPANMWVVSTGTYNNTNRTIVVSVKGYSPPGKYAIYTMESTSVWNGSAISIAGDVGTNGYFDFSGHPGISGSVYFDGPNSGWYLGNNPGGYTVTNEPKELQWPTVDDKAYALFPNAGATAPGGMAYLATHNDNAKVGLPTTNATITNSITLTGPGNYYLTDIELKGGATINFDNSLGPVNVWIGPDGSATQVMFRGGTAAVSATQDPSKQCYIYCATKGGINVAGNEELDAIIYAYNKDSLGNPYGYMLNSGNPTINGQILANKVDINGNLTVNYVPNPVKPTTAGYYGYNNSWSELNSRYQ